MKKTLKKILSEFIFQEAGKRFPTHIGTRSISGETIPVFTNAFWTSKQRQAHSLHEVSYRACFKPQLPRFFIERLTNYGDSVYDPFSGRGTTILEAALFGRNIVSNDVNPLSAILSRPRLSVPSVEKIRERLRSIPMNRSLTSDISLSMFYHKRTLAEIISLRKYLLSRVKKKKEDDTDRWIRMVATNRLTGHSKGFFSVYTLPPNQAMSQSSQRKINKALRQKPEYRDIKEIILKKSAHLVGEVSAEERARLRLVSRSAKFFTGDARNTKKIKRNSVQLTVTSPPFLDVVQYAHDNWLRCWFNGIDAEKIGKQITMSRTTEEWCGVMQEVINELYRITKKNGWVAFEVGEVRNGKIRLEEFVAGMGIHAGFRCEAIMINRQQFTKTANIWGVSNNSKGTNSNRIVLFTK
ncbi:MAG: DNA methyltransferase [Bacteriovoracaceae bacterium]